jgi:hypothetical protein
VDGELDLAGKAWIGGFDTDAWLRGDGIPSGRAQQGKSTNE